MSGGFCPDTFLICVAQMLGHWFSNQGVASSSLTLRIFTEFTLQVPRFLVSFRTNVLLG